MRTIKVQTPQKVPIEYRLAGVLFRSLAYIVDASILFLVYIALFSTVIFITNFRGESQTLFIGTYAVIYVFYSLVFEWSWQGQTPGKRLMGLRVIRLDGTYCSFSDYLTRWAFRFLDIGITFGTLAAMTISANSKGQRIGDIMAGTTVIQTKSPGFSLSKIRKVNTVGEVPKYTLASQLEEQEVLILKKVIDRFRRYPKSEGSMKALVAAAEKMESRLGDREEEKDEDYIVEVIRSYLLAVRA